MCVCVSGGGGGGVSLCVCVCECPRDCGCEHASQGCTILIHEATFEDGMEKDAKAKKHATVGEALTVAERMAAKAVLLTHFSARYPKLPSLGERVCLGCVAS